MKLLEKILSEKTMKALNEKLGEDLVEQINEKTNDFQINVAEEKFIPKHRFDQVNEQLKDYKTQVTEREKQIEDLGKKAKGNEDLSQEINNLKEANEKAKTEYEQKLLAREKEFAIDKFLMESKAKNLKAVKANLDLDKINYSDGKLEGLDNQVNSLKETDDYLFITDKTKGSAGLDPKNSGKSNKDEFAEFRHLR